MSKCSGMGLSVLRRMTTFFSSKKIDKRFKNPLWELQRYIEEPLFKDNEIPFNPTIEEMKMAQRIFMSGDGHKIKCLASVSDPGKLPVHSLPEVTFIGRNYVGKSSLLRALLVKVPGFHIQIAKKPGQEQIVNFIQVGNSFCLVDMPGYGFRQTEHFLKAVEGYLKTRKNLRKTFLLVDAKVGFQKWDEVALDMLEKSHVPYSLIMTKIDKAILAQKLRNMLYLQKIINKNASASCFPHPFMISSVTGEGIAYFQAYIAGITGCLPLQSH